MISLLVSSFRMQAITFIAAPQERNIVSVHYFIWSLHVKGDRNCLNYKFLYCAIISLYSQWSNCSAIFLFSQHAIECTGDNQHGGGLFSE